MTLPANDGHIEYTGDGVATVFPYDFRIDDANELQVWVDGVIVTKDTTYSLDGIGDDDGGDVTFFVAPSAVVAIRRYEPLEQLLDLIPNSALPATSLEAALDKIVKALQYLREELSRRPALAVGTAQILRDLVFPAPSANMLIGWSADELTLTLFPSAVTAESGPVALIGSVEVTVTATAGVAILTATALIPSGVRVKGVVADVTVSFGTGNGLSSVDIGGMGSDDGWGRDIDLTAGTTTTYGDFLRADQPIATSAQDVTITAKGGLFAATGSIHLVVHYETLPLSS